MHLTTRGPRGSRLMAAATWLIGLLGIAFFVRDSWVRPFGGDFLVVMFLYFALRGVTLWSKTVCAVIVVSVAFLIEGAQGAHLVEALGLGGHKLAELLLGATFDPLDLLAYALGLGAAAALDPNNG